MNGKVAKGGTEEAEEASVVGETAAKMNLLSVDKFADHPNIINWKQAAV